MANNKRYYFLKFKEDFFKSEKILLLENSKNGFLYSNILLKLYLLSLKNEGFLFHSKNVPYTTKMLSTLTNHKPAITEKCLETLKELQFIEVLEDGTIYMSDIQTLIGNSSSEAERKKLERIKLSKNKTLATDKSTSQGGHLSEFCPEKTINSSQEYRDKSLEFRNKSLDIRVESVEKGRKAEISEAKNPPPHANLIGVYKNVFLSDKDVETLKNELAEKYEYYINRLSEYMETSGKAYKSHIATIRSWAKEDAEKPKNNQQHNKISHTKADYEVTCSKSL